MEHQDVGAHMQNSAHESGSKLVNVGYKLAKSGRMLKAIPAAQNWLTSGHLACGGLCHASSMGISCLSFHAMLKYCFSYTSISTFWFSKTCNMHNLTFTWNVHPPKAHKVLHLWRAVWAKLAPLISEVAPLICLGGRRKIVWFLLFCCFLCLAGFFPKMQWLRISGTHQWPPLCRAPLHSAGFFVVAKSPRRAHAFVKDFVQECWETTSYPHRNNVWCVLSVRELLEPTVCMANSHDTLFQSVPSITTVTTKWSIIQHAGGINVQISDWLWSWLPRASWSGRLCCIWMNDCARCGFIWTLPTVRPVIFSMFSVPSVCGTDLWDVISGSRHFQHSFTLPQNAHYHLDPANLDKSQGKMSSNNFKFYTVYSHLLQCFAQSDAQNPITGHKNCCKQFISWRRPPFMHPSSRIVGRSQLLLVRKMDPSDWSALL